jgi:hypothetical protein
MAKMGRKEFLGLAGLGAMAAAAGSVRAGETPTGEYTERVRPPAGLGLGKGDGASLSIVWLPADTQLPALKVKLVIFDLAGQPLAENEASLAPFAGASVEFALPKEAKRQQVFGYAFVEGRLDELFGAFEVFDVKSGSTKLAGPVPVA